MGLGREPRLLSVFLNWKTGKRCGWEQVDLEGEAGGEEEGRGGQAALREDRGGAVITSVPTLGVGDS